MATSGSTSTVPEGFHYETKFVLLCYLSLPPRSQSRPSEGASGQTAHETHTDVDNTSRMKEQIEEELKLLEEEITASFPRTGFDRHTSPVFSPANPEISIEDSLAMLGDRVIQDLGTYLTTATLTLLSGQLDYEDFRGAVEELSSHSPGGWSKVLVPLVLLQALQAEGWPLSSLLDLGERYLHEAEADFILQQGGWSAVFSLEDVEDPGLLIAEDSNDIYILSGEQSREQQSSPESLLISVADSSCTASWQAESLPVSLSGHESWAQLGPMEPEDAKSVDSGEGAVSAEERSENNSSNSDIVHVEREEAELLDEGGEAAEVEELLSMLGTESELEALREELRHVAASTEPPAPGAPGSLISLEEPLVIVEAPASLVAASPPVTVEPKSFSSLTVTATATADEKLESLAAPSLPIAAAPPVPEPEQVFAQPEPVLAPVEPQILTPVKPLEESEMKPEAQPEPVQAASVLEVPLQAEIVEAVPARESPLLLQAAPVLASPSQVPVVSSRAAAPVQEIRSEEPQLVQREVVSAQEPSGATPARTELVAEPAPSSEFPILLYGGAVLVAIAALVAYGAYRKK